MTQQDLEERIFAFLSRKYTQAADRRQRAMGLQYTTAETHDLAKEMARFFGAETAPLQKKRMIPERWLGDDEAGAFGGAIHRQVSEVINQRIVEDERRVKLMLARWPAGAGEPGLVYDHRHNLVGLSRACENEIGKRPVILVHVNDVA